LRDLSGNPAVAEHHKDIVRSLGIYQSTKISVGSRISAIGVPAVSDWPTCDEACRDYSGDQRKHLSPAEMALHLIEAAAQLLDKLVQGGNLNGGLRDFRLLRDNGFAGRGVLAQDFHAEGPSGRRHGAEAFYCFLGLLALQWLHEVVRALAEQEDCDTVISQPRGCAIR